MTGEMMEFRITSDLQEVRKNVITTNYPEIKARIDEIVAQYKTRAVTLDTLSSAKADRALLRKAQSGIRDVRKEMREAALSTCAEGEQNCKDIDGALEEGVQYLDSRIKDIENAIKEEKRQRLLDYFTKAVGDMEEWLTFDDCFNPKWLNATTSEDTAKKAIDAIIADTVNEIAAIVSLQSPFEVELLDHYRETHDVTAVLQKNARLLEMKKAQEEREKAAREAAEQKAAETAPVSQPVPPEHPTEEPQTVFFATEVQEEAIYTVDFRVHGTAAQLTGLNVYMKEHGIRFGRVPK